MAVVVIFALEREAKPFRKMKLPVRIIVSGVGMANARRAMDGVDATLVISAGFCGALNPELRVGDVIVVSRDAESAERSAGTATTSSVLQPPALVSADSDSPLNIVTVPHLVATAHEKQLLREHTNADIVDMEAAAIREICESRGIPFLAVKAVSDTAEQSLSPRLVELLNGGSISARKALGAILRQPSILFEFVRLAINTRRAAKNLAVCLQEVCGRFVPSPVA